MLTFYPISQIHWGLQIRVTYQCILCTEFLSSQFRSHSELLFCFSQKQSGTVCERGIIGDETIENVIHPVKILGVISETYLKLGHWMVFPWRQDAEIILWTSYNYHGYYYRFLWKVKWLYIKFKKKWIASNWVGNRISF